MVHQFCFKFGWMMNSNRASVQIIEQSEPLGNGVHDDVLLKHFFEEIVFLQSQIGIYGTILKIWEMKS